MARKTGMLIFFILYAPILITLIWRNHGNESTKIIAMVFRVYGLMTGTQVFNLIFFTIEILDIGNVYSKNGFN